MHCNTYLPRELQVAEHVWLQVSELSARFATVPDPRGRRGRRYQLAWLFILTVIAKLADQHTPQAIARWARLRWAALQVQMEIPAPRAPSAQTFRRVWALTIAAETFETWVSRYLQPLLAPTAASGTLAIDGKTLRGCTDPDHGDQPVSVVAVYDLDQERVLKQVLVRPGENEIPAAARALQGLDLQGKVVVADALHTQRSLASQIGAQGGDYLFRVKRNQPQLLADITAAFEPSPLAPGHNALPLTCTCAQTHTQAHGRSEQRTLIATAELRHYLDWPGACQVFKLVRSRRERSASTASLTITYGITSLPPERAPAAELLRLVRRYWGIESRLHYPRDVFLDEDATQMSTPAQALNWATLNTLILGLARLSGAASLPAFLALMSAYLARLS
jgi:predicted transposase YbfD/YdcC